MIKDQKNSFNSSKELVFRSKFIKLQRINDVNLEVQENFSSLIKYSQHLIDNLKSSSNKRIIIEIVNLNNKFFYGIAHYIQNYLQFKKAFFKFFVNLFYKCESKELFYKSDFCIQKNVLIIDFEFLKNYLNFCTCDSVAQNRVGSLELRINGINLKESCDIIMIWTSIVNHWLNKKAKYEGYWAFFSTLGGAYSSLGEESYEHAKNAERISKKQLNLAYAFNDPNAICRCKLFLAFSYIQLTKFKEANFILRHEYKYLKDKSKSKNITDEKLKVMCVAGLKKLRFAIEQYRINKAYFSDRGKLRS